MVGAGMVIISVSGHSMLGMHPDEACVLIEALEVASFQLHIPQVSIW